jgi:hypothetical protein
MLMQGYHLEKYFILFRLKMATRKAGEADEIAKGKADVSTATVDGQGETIERFAFLADPEVIYLTDELSCVSFDRQGIPFEGRHFVRRETKATRKAKKADKGKEGKADRFTAIVDGKGKPVELASASLADGQGTSPVADDVFGVVERHFVRTETQDPSCEDPHWHRIFWSPVSVENVP